MKINQKQMEKAMKMMGMKTEPIEAEEVVIKRPGGEIVITNPEVTRINVMGQEMYQIAGASEERAAGKFSDADVRLVAGKTGATEEEARAALSEEGDIAAAILRLKK
jgi:nascent polypeptide-associated complex subunit alpha